MAPLGTAFKRPLKLAMAAKLPAVAAGKWYGTPGLLVKGKGFMRVKDADTLVFRCGMEEKELLMEAAPAIYFETDHYKGWPAVLVRLSHISDPELRQCIVRAWRAVAPRKLVDAYSAPPVAFKPPPRKKPRVKANSKKR